MRLTTIALLPLFTFSAQAADIGSAYTKLEDAGCRTVAEYEAGATSYCRGFRDVWFRIDDGDARISVTYGIDPDAPPEQDLSLIHISEPTRRTIPSRMPSSA
mgnify:CR=1 FL=1